MTAEAVVGPLGYALLALRTDNDNLKALVSALYGYYKAAEEYFN